VSREEAVQVLNDAYRDYCKAVYATAWKRIKLHLTLEEQAETIMPELLVMREAEKQFRKTGFDCRYVWSGTDGYFV
jgi:hypothetical protein